MKGITTKSARVSVMVYWGADLFAVKWHDWKAVLKGDDAGNGAAIKVFPTPAIYDLINDPREEQPVSCAVESNS